MKYIQLIFFLLNAIIVQAETYTIQRLGLENGLSNNYVTDIAEDKNGFLWFATEEGLNKLEGNSFFTYYKTEKGKQCITGNELNCLLDDPEEPVLWIGTQRAGLNAFNYETNTFTVYRHDKNNPSSLATDDVTGILPSTDGNLWITTYWKGIDYLNKETGKCTHYNSETVPQFPENNVLSAMEDGRGNLFIGHRNKGLTILTLKNKQVRNFMNSPQNPKSIPGNEVNCIYQDNTGNIWIGTDNGLAIYNTENAEFIRFGKNNNPLAGRIFNIRQLNDKRLWVATETGGIAIIDLSQHFFSAAENVKIHYIEEGDNEYSLSSSSVRCIFQDSYNNIWTGLWGGGINFINSNTTLFNAYRYSPNQTGSNLNSRTASAVCTDTQNRLWVGTDGGGINVLENGKRIKTFTEKDGQISGNSVQTAFRDTKGNLWFGIFQGGIMFYDQHKRKFRQLLPNELEKADVRTIFEDLDGLMWIGTSNGIYQMTSDTKKIIKHIDVPNNLVRTILKDTAGRVWVGTFGGGLFLYSANMEHLKTFDTFASFPSNTINHIYEDCKQNIWVATGDGLIQFPPNEDLKYNVYKREKGLVNTHIRAIIEDNSGNIWLSTNKGISCLLSGYSKICNYNNKDNIPLASFTSGSVCKDINGELYFGSIGGLCYFSPEFVLRKRTSPQAIITRINVMTPLSLHNEKEQNFQLNGRENIRLEHDQNNFQISFCIPNYALANQTEYAYMLKGMENSWYTISNDNGLTFRNLPYGTYEFLVKARIRNQKWPEKSTSLLITIAPPLWLSWWAKLGYIIFILGILSVFLHIYKRRINLEYLYESEKWSHEQEQKLNDERLRFFTNITHELRTPLTLIIGPLEDMQESTTLTGKDKRRISVIHQSAVRLLNLVNQILEFRKTETQNKKLCVCKSNIVSVVYETGLKYKELNRNPHIAISIHTEEENMELFFDKEAITIILDNLVSNALKYTEKGQISIGAQWVEEQNVRYLELSIRDTGYGISPEALSHIFERYYQEGSHHQASGTGIGLALVKNLVNLHEGTIQAESQLNVGTVFRIRLIAANTYPNALHKDEEETSSSKTPDKNDPEEMKQNTLSDNQHPVVLIVEDNEDIMTYIVDSFTDLYEVKTARNGKEGMEIALESIPDLIVSDIMMPIMDGITMCRKLKKDIRTSHIPIILLTAKDTLTDKEEGYLSGADSYLTKPFSASLLHSRINNLLTQRRHLAEHYSEKIVSEKITTKELEEKHSIITDSLNKIDKEFLDKMKHIIIENLSATEAIDINYLASTLCMSSSTLYRKTKALTGMSTNEYIRKIKMQLAEKMLLEGKYNISEIAFKVGINSTVYFRQCFKEEFGLTPSDYLKKIKEG